MLVSIQAIVSILDEQRNLQANLTNFCLPQSRWSNGYRITKESDGVPGLGILSNLHAHIRSVNQTLRNVFNGLSVNQTEESASNEISKIMIRMSRLSIKSISCISSDLQRSYYETKLDATSHEVELFALPRELTSEIT